jgi:hypothetical protein
MSTPPPGDPANAAPPNRPSVPARPARPTRPRWLVAALVAALVFGAGAWTEGCERLSLYHGDPEAEYGKLNAQIQDEAARGRAEALFQKFIDVSERERGTTIPFAAATFVLGAALLALSARGLAGRTNPRSVLVQVVVAQAIVYGASWFVTKDFRLAENEWNIEYGLHAGPFAPPAAQVDEARAMARTTYRALDPIWLIFKTAASGLIVFALTRPRSREFFEAAAAAHQVTER